MTDEVNFSIEEAQPIDFNVIEETPVNFSIEAGGVITFLGLSDTPTNYTGSENKFVKVNSSGDAVEFVTSSATVSWGGITGTLSEQTDLNTELNNITTTNFKGSKVYLDEDSDTYIWWNSSNSKIELVKSGDVVQRW